MAMLYRGWIVVNIVSEVLWKGTRYSSCGAYQLYLDWHDALHELSPFSSRYLGLAELRSTYRPQWDRVVGTVTYYLDPAIGIWREHHSVVGGIR